MKDLTILKRLETLVANKEVSKNSSAYKLVLSACKTGNPVARPCWHSGSGRFCKNMERYNYLAAVCEDVHAYIEDNETISNTPANLAKLHALAVNGAPMYYIWLDAVDDAATSLVYLTEAAARADIARLEIDDKEAGVYEPAAYRVVNAAPYFS